jgi:hypothetical protein
VLGLKNWYLESNTVPLTGPDYQAIAISKAARDLFYLPGFGQEVERRQKADCTLVAKLYFSKAFPLEFFEFRDRIIEAFEDIASENEDS